VLHLVDSKAIEHPSLQDSPLPLPISPIEKTGRSLYQDFRTGGEILAVKLDRFLAHGTSGGRDVFIFTALLPTATGFSIREVFGVLSRLYHRSPSPVFAVPLAIAIPAA
jgi:hypothetical protein